MTQAGTGSATSTYGYDYAGNRTSQTVGAVTTKYANKLYSSTGATTTKYIFAGDTLVATVEKTTTATTTFITHLDHLGGSNVVSDNNGEVAQVIDYYPYGSLRINVQNTSLDEKRKYTGEHYDAEVALSYLNARYYDGARGQFLSQDPMFLSDPSRQNLSDPQSLNSYSYGEGNPITKSDPSGRDAGVLTIGVPLLVLTGVVGIISSYSFSYENRWGKNFGGPIQVPDMSKYLNLSGEGGGPLPTNPNAPKWIWNTVKVGIGVVLSSVGLCYYLGADCTDLVDNPHPDNLKVQPNNNGINNSSNLNTNSSIGSPRSNPQTWSGYSHLNETQRSQLLDPQVQSRYAPPVVEQNGIIYVRVPGGRLNFADPSRTK